MPCGQLWITRKPGFRDAVLRASPMRDAAYATLFTYMYRRFGIPPLPGDDYKDLCGGWMLTTPSPSLIVLVHPSLTGTEFSFTPYYVRGRNDPPVRDVDDLKLSAEEVSSLKSAYQTLLLDLMRPVGVRDSYMNALGDVDDDSSLLRCDKDGEYLYEAKRHASAGFGVPAGLVGCKDWATLCALLAKAGDGDVVAGSAAVVAKLRAPVLAQAAAESLAVKRLIVLGSGADRVAIGPSLGLAADELERVIDETALFYGQVDRDGAGSERARRLNAILDETPDAVADMAASYLARLAYEPEKMSEPLNRALMDRAMHEAWTDLVASGDGEFPHETIPLESRDAADLHQSLRSNFEAGGHAGLMAWLDRTLARRRGPEALSWIVMHLRQMSKAEAAE